MTLPSLIWGSPEWTLAALSLAAVSAAVLIWGYARASGAPGVRLIAGTLKAMGFTALILFLVEPLLSGTRPRSGANLFALVVDNSQSLAIRDSGDADPRGERLHRALLADETWQARLGQDFDLRSYLFDTHLRSVKDYSELTFDGAGTSLHTSLAALSSRFRGLPAAGVLLFTDGNATDEDHVAWNELPPVYPVVIGRERPPRDVSVERITVSQTNFESAPVVIRADVSAAGYAGERVVAELLDEAGSQIQRQTAEAPTDGKPLSFRFQLRPSQAGVSFYTVAAAASGQDDEVDETAEDATSANNRRAAVVDRGGGPYRVLYVTGRPNWEFKFLRRALAEDDQLELVGLVRIARREPRFTFRDRNDSSNRLFDGFDHPDEESAERYDQPVLVRLGTIDENELRDGFPAAADQLYRYHAVILDDVEAAYFSQDQLTLLQKFVGQRGGGLLMLGGVDTYDAGAYRRTPVGDMLPVYLTGQSAAAAGEYRLALSREGWLQPWVRLRDTEDQERLRLSGMAPFQRVTRVGNIKPGASVLAQVTDAAGQAHPALVAQRYGQGRVASLLIGDLWRWGMRREAVDNDDLEMSWRQTVRWLVADVPERVEMQTKPRANSPSGAVDLTVRVRDPEYLPLDNAQVNLRVTAPDGGEVELTTEPSDAEAGAYTASYVPRQPGAYRAAANVRAPDGSQIGQREAGWAAQGAADEFNRLTPNRGLLEQIAQKTGGEVVALEDLDGLVADLPNRKAPVEEPWIYPLWHHPLLFLVAIACLIGEWGLRRIKGLP
jgi:uncharacterized membrane protein